MFHPSLTQKKKTCQTRSTAEQVEEVPVSAERQEMQFTAKLQLKQPNAKEVRCEEDKLVIAGLRAQAVTPLWPPRDELIEEPRHKLANILLVLSWEQ